MPKVDKPALRVVEGKPAKKPTTFEVDLVFETETKGAVRFLEVDADGEPVEFKEAMIGTIYIRKLALRNGVVPKRVTVKVTAEY